MKLDGEVDLVIFVAAINAVLLFLGFSKKIGDGDSQFVSLLDLHNKLQLTFTGRGETFKRFWQI